MNFASKVCTSFLSRESPLSPRLPRPRRAPVQFGPVHVVEPSAALELRMSSRPGRSIGA